MFLDANMSNQVEQKLKENFPSFIEREIFKVTSIFNPKNRWVKSVYFNFGDYDKDTQRTQKMALSACSFPIMPPYLTF